MLLLPPPTPDTHTHNKKNLDLVCWSSDEFRKCDVTVGRTRQPGCSRAVNETLRGSCLDGKGERLLAFLSSGSSLGRQEEGLGIPVRAGAERSIQCWGVYGPQQPPTLLMEGRRVSNGLTFQRGFPEEVTSFLCSRAGPCLPTAWPVPASQGPEVTASQPQGSFIPR